MEFEWNVVDPFRQFAVRNIRQIHAPLFSHQETPNNYWKISLFMDDSVVLQFGTSLSQWICWLNYILFKILSHMKKRTCCSSYYTRACDTWTLWLIYSTIQTIWGNEVQWRGFRHRRTRVSLPQIHFSLSKHRLCCHVPSAFTRRKNDLQYSIWRHRSRTIQDMLRFIYTGKVLKMDSFAAGLVITGSKYLLR